MSNALYDQAPQLGDFLWTLGKVIAILNFFNLLPFWPLDGSKCLLLVFHTFFPSQTQNLSYVMSGAALAAGLYLQSIFLILFVLISVRGLLRSGTFLKIQHEMSKGRAVLWLRLLHRHACGVPHGVWKFALRNPLGRLALPARRGNLAGPNRIVR